jgi:hypothetical protein
MEHKLVLDVLDAKGARRWRNWGARALTCAVSRGRDLNNQAVVVMKVMPKIDRLQCGALPDESRFEKPEIGPFRETAGCAHFGWKLKKIFPLPSASSEPENVLILLRKIQAKLDNPRVPGEG